MHALDALELQHRCLEMGSLANIWASAYDPQAGLHEVAQMERAAALQLLSVRKQCKFEGLGDTLELVMSKLGVSERDAEYWESLTKQEPTGQKLLQLGELRDPDSNEQRKDRLTRTNEWMLGVFYAFPYFIELHRKILILEEIELRESSKSSDIHQWKEDRWSLSETTQRTMVKFWFLDSAAMSEEEYATSHIPGSDSDATFRRLDEEIKIPDDMLSEAYEAEPDTERNTEIAEAEFKMMMSKKTAPILNLPSDPSQRVDVDEAGQVLPQEEIPHELPPDRISGKVLAAASRAVADYEQEPSRAFDD